MPFPQDAESYLRAGAPEAAAEALARAARTYEREVRHRVLGHERSIDEAEASIAQVGGAVLQLLLERWPVRRPQEGRK